MSDTPDYTSKEYWLRTINDLAESFEETLIKKFGGGPITEQKLIEALKIFGISWDFFDEAANKKNTKEVHFDTHEKIAICILSILKTEPFRPGIPETKDDVKESLFLANELFCVKIMKTLISKSARMDEVFQMNKKEYDWFIILLNSLKAKLEKPNMKKINKRIISPDDPSDMVDVLWLSQIIYYIEKSYIS